MYSSGDGTDGPQRRFGNAFSGFASQRGAGGCSHRSGECDRLFLIRGDDDKHTITQEAKHRCSLIRECQGVFVWKQSTHALLGNPEGPGVKATRPQQASTASYAAVGLASGDRVNSGVFGNFFSYDTMFNRADLKGTPLLAFPDLLNLEPDNLHFLTSGRKGAVTSKFESESWVKETTCPKGVCSYYSGACVHRATGFCMDEVPGTSQCLDNSFDHCNDPKTLN